MALVEVGTANGNGCQAKKDENPSLTLGKVSGKKHFHPIVDLTSERSGVKRIPLPTPDCGNESEAGGRALTKCLFIINLITL